MTYFCTLFDSFYLSRGLAMYESLKEHTKDFHLYVFAFDALSCDILKQLTLDYTTVISLEEFESKELKEVKKTRTVAEYCWTCTPSTISYVLKNFGVPNCTYIDSDLFFYSDPLALVSEMNDNSKSVLITEHRYSLFARLYEERRSGRFCVQFITFLNVENSLKILERWRTQCIDWCYARHEDGKFGDQKYLDEWPDIYPNVHILEHQGGGIAPWNLTKYDFAKYENSIIGKVRQSGEKFSMVFFHFQYVKFLENGSCDIGWYYISREKYKLFYLPYLERIKGIEARLRIIHPSFKTGITKFKGVGLKNLLKTVLKKTFSYNIISSY